MNQLPKDNQGMTGPFEVVFQAGEALSTLHSSNAAEALHYTLNEAADPHRNLECQHYETCLNLAAALNWDSFTCQGCSGSINESLKWRAGQNTRRDAVAKAICGAPKATIVKGGSLG
jgi:hypothetical protein